MTAEVLQELKSMRNDPTGQIIKKLRVDLTNFQRDTNARLAKIESAMLKIDEIDNLNTRAHKLEDVGRMKVSLTKMNSTVEAIEINTEASLKPLQESNRELKNKLEHLERYSRDFNIHLIGVEEEDGEACMAIVSDHFKILRFEDGYGVRKCSSHREKTGRQSQAHHCKIVQQTFQEKLALSCEESREERYA